MRVRPYQWVVAEFGRPLAVLSLRDAYATRLEQAAAASGERARRVIAPRGDVSLWLLPAADAPSAAGMRLLVQRTASGALAWFGSALTPHGPRRIQTDELLVEVRADNYQTRRLRVPRDPEHPCMVALEPSCAYPAFRCGRYARRHDGTIHYPTLLCGRIVAPRVGDSDTDIGRAEAVVRVTGFEGEYRTDASGRWALAIEVVAASDDGAPAPAAERRCELVVTFAGKTTKHQLADLEAGAVNSIPKIQR